MSLLPHWRVMPSLLNRRANHCGLVGDSCLRCWLGESNLVLNSTSLRHLIWGIMSLLSDCRVAFLVDWKGQAYAIWSKHSECPRSLIRGAKSLLSSDLRSQAISIWSSLIKGTLSSAIWLENAPSWRKSKVGTNHIKWGSRLQRIESTGGNDSSS